MEVTRIITVFAVLGLINFVVHGAKITEVCTKDNHQNSGWLNLNCDLTQEKDPYLNITQEDISEKTRNVNIIDGLEIKILKNAFGSTKELQKVELKSIKNLLIMKSAFERTKTTNLILNIINCKYVVIESDAFLQFNGSMDVNITNCYRVELGNNSFTRVKIVNIENVTHLILDKKVFQNDISDRSKNMNKVILSNVTVSTFDKECFGKGLSQIIINSSTIDNVGTGAFSAKEYKQIIFENTAIDVIHSEAFGNEVVCDKLFFVNCVISRIESNAIRHGCTNFKISHSRIEHIKDMALNMVVATVEILDNKFEEIETGGIVFSKPNTVLIERNVFNRTFPKISFEVDKEFDKFSYMNNFINRADSNSLYFINDSSKEKDTKYNFFNDLCPCDTVKWLKNKVNSEKNITLKLNDFFKNNYCVVHRKCKELKGYIFFSNYLEFYCDNRNLSCADVKNKVIIPDLPWSYSICDPLDSEMELKNLESKKTWLLIILGVALCTTFIIMLVIVLIQMKRKGHCANAKNEMTSCSAFFERLFSLNYGIDTASISRMSINAYNENHMLHERTLNEDNRTLISGNSIEDFIETAEKATQTLPEELTKELLESLREKLDDPENYGEAREMIEHLYDLIKVEEYCNMNNNNSSQLRHIDDDSTENLYDIIQQPRIHQGKNMKTMVSVGTKVPSLEKLFPSSPYTKLCHEYFEPQDRAVHLYSELLPNKRSDGLSHTYSTDDILKSNSMNFLRAIETSINASKMLNNSNQTNSPKATPGPSGLNLSNATQISNKSSKSAKSDGSGGNMANRPLPDKPRNP